MTCGCLPGSGSGTQRPEPLEAQRPRQTRPARSPGLTAFLYRDRMTPTRNGRRRSGQPRHRHLGHRHIRQTTRWIAKCFQCNENRTCAGLVDMVGTRIYDSPEKAPDAGLILPAWYPVALRNRPLQLTLLNPEPPVLGESSGGCVGIIRPGRTGHAGSCDGRGCRNRHTPLAGRRRPRRLRRFRCVDG